MNTYQLLLVSLCFGILGAYLAIQRKKNPYLWFFIGVFFGMLGVFMVFMPFKKKKPQRRRRVQRQPQAYIEGPSGCFWYYLNEANEQKGPMSLMALTQALKKGEVAPSTFVWNEELPEWKALQELIRSPTSSP